jgi:hypothetical protein
VITQPQLPMEEARELYICGELAMTERFFEGIDACGGSADNGTHGDPPLSV